MYLSELVSDKSLFARIDRPAGIVTFSKKASPGETLNEWSDDIAQLLDLVEKSTHLIHKEIMVHNM